MGYLQLLDQFEKEEIEGRGLKVNWRWHNARFEFALWLEKHAAQQSVQRTCATCGADLVLSGVVTTSGKVGCAACGASS